MTGKPREKYHIVYLRCWCQIQIIPVDAPPSPWYVQPLEYSQANENGMQVLELDTPTETVSVLESLPPSEGLTADLQV